MRTKTIAPENMMFGNRLALLRQREGFKNQTAFAKILSEFMMKDIPISPLTISSWENGSKYPSFLTIIYLAKFFDVSLDYLVGMSDIETIATHPNAVVNKSSGNRTILPDETVIQPNDLKKYDGQPIFVCFDDMQYQNQWGILNMARKRIQMKDVIVNIGSFRCTYHSAAPQNERMDPAGMMKKPYSLTQLMKQDKVWISMLSVDTYLQGLYDGYYMHNGNNSALVNCSNGLVLPYTGLGIAYNAYSIL